MRTLTSKILLAVFTLVIVYSIWGIYQDQMETIHKLGFSTPGVCEKHRSIVYETPPYGFYEPVSNTSLTGTSSVQVTEQIMSARQKTLKISRVRVSIRIPPVTLQKTFTVTSRVVDETGATIAGPDTREITAADESTAFGLTINGKQVLSPEHTVKLTLISTFSPPKPPCEEDNCVRLLIAWKDQEGDYAYFWDPRHQGEPRPSFMKPAARD